MTIVSITWGSNYVLIVDYWSEQEFEEAIFGCSMGKDIFACEINSPYEQDGQQVKTRCRLFIVVVVVYNGLIKRNQIYPWFHDF